MTALDELPRFGSFEIDPVRMELRRHQRRVELHERPLRLLLYLILHRDRVVSKEELLAEIWPGASVTEASVTTAIGEVRRALDDDGKHQRWVRTLKGEGFRFVGGLEAVPPPSGRVRPMGIAAGVAGLLAILAGVWALWPSQPSGAAPPTSLVVLPFDDLSPEGDQDYFAHGMSEELANTLSHVSELRVVGRTSAEAVKARRLSIPEIGEVLDVGAVVEGSVRMADEQLRITVQVVAVADGFHLWSEQYDRPLGDVFAVQNEIALAVASALEVRLLGRHTRRSPDPRDYELYLTGRHFWNRRTEDGLRRAISYFEEALGVDPEFALAHAGLASARSVLFTWGHEDVGILKQAEASADDALALDEYLPEGHA
ncbi:MAG: winged helix-turn-helix domain-containing protein, partial [Longimicrobiales bacterium]